MLVAVCLVKVKRETSGAITFALRSWPSSIKGPKGRSRKARATAARSWVERFGSDFKRSLKEKARTLMGAPREVVEIDMSNSFGGRTVSQTGEENTAQAGREAGGGAMGVQWMLEGDARVGMGRGGQATKEGEGGAHAESGGGVAGGESEYVPRCGTKKDLRAAMDRQRRERGGLQGLCAVDFLL